MGGINNMFEIMFRCYKYCLAFNRILVIDTRFVATFGDDIHKYLKFKPEIIFKGDIDSLFLSLKTSAATFYPDIFTLNKEKRYENIIGRFKFTKEGYCCKVTETITKNISIKLADKDYKEDVIIYANCIGGPSVLEIFKICEFKPILRETIIKRLEKIPKPFISIHLRNTDRKSDTSSFLKKYQGEFKGKNVFIATDNYSTLLQAKEILGDKYIFHFSNLPTNEKLIGKPIHENKFKPNKEEFVLDCISDFVMLCFGEEYYYSCAESGYSKNVALLRKNMDVVKSLL